MKKMIAVFARTSATYKISLLFLIAALSLPVSCLADESPAGALEGTVNVAGVDGKTHCAAGAKVRLISGSQNDWIIAVADVSGKYNFERLLPGRYVIAITIDGLETIARLVTITAGETTIENITIAQRSTTASYDSFAHKTIAARVETNESSPSYHFKLTPEVFDQTKLFKPRDLPGDLTPIKFGAHEKSIGRMYGLSFVIHMR